MILKCIDIGNTNVVVGTYIQNKLKNIERFESEISVLEQELKISNSCQIAISSVVPKINKYLTERFSENLIFEVSHQNCGLCLDVDKPSEVGNDRICNIKSILELKLFPAIIIDFGSATTYDVIDAKGAFIGGSIAPGVDVSAQYLIKKAAQLKSITYQFPKKVIGKNTKTNLQSGIMYGGIDAINGMIKRIHYEISFKIKNIILTGGFAKILSSRISYEHIVAPELTINGIKLILEENN